MSDFGKVIAGAAVENSPRKPTLFHSIKTHFWIGKLLFDSQGAVGHEFLGVVVEVSDNCESDSVYVMYTYDDGAFSYRYVKRTATVEDGVIHLK